MDADARQKIATLAEMVASDDPLPAHIRQRARELRADALENHELALAHLVELSEETAPLLARDAPQDDLARCVGMEVYWLHHLDRDRRESYVSANEYADFVRDAADPGDQLQQDLSQDPIVFPAPYSWMVPSDQIQGLNGLATQVALASVQRPPLVVFEMPLALLLASGVTVRHPRAIDAVPRQHVQWQPGGLPSGIPEFVDGDVPLQAVAETEWRP